MKKVHYKKLVTQPATYLKAFSNNPTQVMLSIEPRRQSLRARASAVVTGEYPKLRRVKISRTDQIKKVLIVAAAHGLSYL
jgi:hypothetical protein